MSTRSPPDLAFLLILLCYFDWISFIQITKNVLRVLDCYISPTKLYNQALEEGSIALQIEDNYYWTNFQDCVSREAVVKGDGFFVKAEG
jgi:hypothetical protein